MGEGGGIFVSVSIVFNCGQIAVGYLPYRRPGTDSKNAMPVAKCVPS